MEPAKRGLFDWTLGRISNIVRYKSSVYTRGMTMLALTPLFMLTVPPVIPTTLILLPCSTSLTTSLFITWPPWPPSPHPNGPLIQAALTRSLFQLALPLHTFSHGISQPTIVTHTTWVNHLSMVTPTWDIPLRD